MPRRGNEQVSRAVRPAALTIKWSYSRRCFTVDLPPWREFFRWETLESAVEHHLAVRDNWMLPALESLENGAAITSLKLDLAASMAYQFMFDVTVGYANRRVHKVTLCVARNDREHAAPFRDGWNGLVRLHGILPEYCAKPLRSGKIFLPDRYNRNALHRDLPAALIQLPVALWGPITPVTPVQLGIREKAGKAPTLMSAAETVHLQQKLTACFLGLYDPDRQMGHVLDANPPWEWVTWREKGTKHPGLCLVSAVLKWTHCVPAKYLIRLLAAELRGSKVSLPVLPDDPGAVWACLRESGFLRLVPALGETSLLPEKPPAFLSRASWSRVIRKYRLLMENRPERVPAKQE